MATKAYFYDIKKLILEKIDSAKKTLRIAVPWFTDRIIFDSLIDASTRGVNIKLITLDDEINKNSGLNYNDLLKQNPKNKVVLIQSSLSKRSSIMHNKYCIIDDNSVINGSYNWTYRAHSNDESVTLHDESEIIKEFESHFNFLLDRYDENKSIGTSNYGLLWYLTNSMKITILAGDEPESNRALEKFRIQQFDFPDNVKSTVSKLISFYEKDEWFNVLEQIGVLNKTISKEAMKLYYIAEDFEIQGNLIKSIEVIDLCIEVKPDLDIAWIKLSELHEKCLNRNFRNTKVSPDSKVADNAIIADSDFKALHYSNIAQVINPHNLNAILNHSDIVYQITSYVGFPNEDEIRELIYLNPKNTEILIYSGNSLLEGKRFSDAESILKKAIKLDPFHIKPYGLLGRLYTHTENYEKAIEYLSKYLSFIDDDFEILMCYIVSLINVDRLEESLKYLAKAKGIRPKDQDVIDYIKVVNKELKAKR